MITFIVVLGILILILFICIARTYWSTKPIAGPVLRLLLSAMLPVLGNIIIIMGQHPVIAAGGYIVYFIGTDIMLLFLLRYILLYCSFEHFHLRFLVSIYCLGFIDCVMILLNPWLHHVFDLQPTHLSDGTIYYRLESLWYHYIHLGLSLFLVVLVLAIVLQKLISCPALYREKYLVILFSILVEALWEAYYIASNIPVDMSMLGYVACGVLVYYFSIEYVPYYLMDRMLSNIVSHLSDGLLFYDEGDSFVYANSSAYHLFHLSTDEQDKLQGAVFDLVGEENWPIPDGDVLPRSFDTGSQTLSLEISKKKLFDKRGLLIGSFVNIQDRTDEERRLANERYLSTHDKLTGLYNAEYFYQRAAQLLADHPDREYMLISSDIKEFKLINDIYGSRTGDAILVKLARTLENHATKESVYGRINNDIFALLMPKDHYSEELFTEGAKALPYVESDMNFPIIIHIGVYEVTDRSLPVIIMLDRCFLAIASIKQDVEKRVAYYDDRIRADILWEQVISGSLDEAMNKGELVPYLQSQVDAEGKVAGAEVLVRWNHSQEGFLTPGRFIPVLEKNGMIVNMDRYIWESACQILARWKAEGHTDTYLSVNISHKDFYFLDIYQCFTQLVEKYDIDPEMLRLQITETIVMSDIEHRLITINQLRDYGFIVEMDDFGSGYSSLSMLKDLPIDVLKIDMKFLYQTDYPVRGRTILDLIIKMAKDLEMPVVAEGVETEEQVGFLSEMGCDMFQGYYFAKPVPVTVFEESTFR